MSDDDDKTGIPNNLQAINFDKDKDKSRAMIENMKRNMDTMGEMLEITAKIKRKQFEAFVAEGFTEDQALKMIMQQ